MLSSRIITTGTGSNLVTVSAVRGCPQGGVLSPLLWTIVVDDLLHKLSDGGFEVVGYADDLVIMVRGKVETVICDRMEAALRLVSSWCKAEGLNVNPSKAVIVPFTRKYKVSLRDISLNGSTIPFQDSFKYLGVTLDKRLNWNKHISGVTRRAIRAFWACSGLFGKSWGLSPKMIFWLYTSIIRPIVAYAAVVWWTKVSEKSTQLKLQKVQRLVCLGMTGAMRTCPTAPIEAIVGIAPLFIFIKKTAASSAIKMHRQKNYKVSSLSGHLSILKELGELDKFIYCSDYLPKQYNFHAKFNIIIPERSDWEEGSFQADDNGLRWYTDGSRMNDRSGLGIYGPNCNISLGLGSYPSVFQAEVLAIHYCALHILSKRMKGGNFYIFSDSQAALKSLKNPEICSKIVQQCWLTLNELARGNKITLVWVPGHRGIDGNEKADELARQGSDTNFIGPEPFCALPSGALFSPIKIWEKRTYSDYWDNQVKYRQAKRLIRPLSYKDIHKYSKNDLRNLTGLLTGHCSLNYHMCKLGIVELATCRLCNEEDETSEHILCHCEAIGRTRLQYLGREYISPFELWKISPDKILRFIRKLRIL
jgi:ribonuclease HI